MTLHHEGLDTIVCQTLGIDLAEHPIDLRAWEEVVRRVHSSTQHVRIGVIGKYVTMPDAYLSVGEAIRHAGFAVGVKTDIEWLEAERVPGEIDADRLRGLDGIIVPGGFGERGFEGMIAAAKISRDSVSYTHLDVYKRQLQGLSELRDDYEGLLSAIEVLDGDSDDAILSQFARVLTCLLYTSRCV